MARSSAAPTSGPALDNRRVLAALIDVAIIAVGYFVILLLPGMASTSGGSTTALDAVWVGWALYYYFAMESGNGQTVGKRAMKIRVVGMDGQPAGMRAIGLRTVLRVIDGLAVYLVGLIAMLVTGERRARLGDLAGKTMIVSADKPAPAPNMSAPEMPAAVSRVPIAESGPAFAEEAPPAAEAEAVAESEPVADAEPVAPVAEAAEPVAEAEPAVASPALVELASDVSAVTDDPEREVEPEPEPEIEELPPAATLAAEAAEKEAAEKEAARAEAAHAEAASEEAASAEAASEEAASDEPARPEAASEEAPEDELAQAEPRMEELPSAETEEVEVDEDDGDAAHDEDVEVEEDEDDEVEELDAEADEKVTVKSVETVSAIDLVMEDERG